jgi:benzoate 4-monooxygenase
MLAVGAAVAVFAWIVWRWHFSPLSTIPGPKLAALTSLYYTFHEFRGDRYLFIDRLHREYGPIVRIGPNHVSISDPAALKEIYGVGSWDKPRGGWYTHFSAYGEDNMFSVWDGREHLKRKKVQHRVS